ncbi:AraC-type DNA-binding protein [Promicromonospora umidemergens]|uniref:Helix-turn-helix transcriptional regulator n=1 Tax=Promicromonospora umidemergens TaxID=629679 RepID=A0ABP8XEC0_9MICO|nr:AraC-type DNA-binding protein [Promicromonospora umidemergens]
MVPVTYRELAPPTGLLPVVACLWEHDAPPGHEQRIIPDGCVDLVRLDGELVVVGADTGPVVAVPAATPASRTSGIRLRPGAAGAVLGLPASEVRDQRVPLADVWPDVGPALAAALSTAHPAGRLDLLARTVLHRRAERDGLVAAAARQLGTPGSRIAVVADDLGVSERHLHRRTVAAVGYGPKMLGRVARLRRLIGLSAGPPSSLADRAARAGYASQAHMSDEVRRLTGRTPVRFLEDAALTAA